jgi:isopenicillin-N epimerase
MNKSIANQRRGFLKKATAASFAAWSVPMLALSNPPVQLTAGGDNPDEAYWELVKKQFAVPDKLLMVNAANLCPCPYQVNEQVLSFQQALARDVSFQYRALFSKLRSESISLLADFVGVSAQEIGITRNTSESNCIVVNGLDLKQGDEIVLWDQNHPSNKESWHSRAKRSGLVVKEVAMPAVPQTVDDVVSPIAGAITNKTRLIAFSHVSNVSGIALPAKQICALARSKGVLSLVDGAQGLGFIDLDLRDMGCDFYTASTHKWLMGPLENGILYVQKAHIDKVWPNVIGGGWHDGGKTVDEKICVLGQRNETSTAALPDVIRFHTMIGKEQIERRVRTLASYLKSEIRKRLPDLKFVTPLQEELSGGIVVVQLPGKEPRTVIQQLYDSYGIASASTVGVRFSPHVYNTLADIGRIVDALGKVAAS